MKFDVGDRVQNLEGSAGTVIEADAHMISVQFDHGGRPGWFDREDDNRLTRADRGQE